MNAFHWSRAALALCALAALAGCGASVAPAGDGGAPEGGASDAEVTCARPDGTRAPVGSSWADDCNTCTCAPGGSASCTLRACATDAGPAVDAGARACETSAECGSDEDCEGPDGCGVQWYCRPIVGCTADEAPFCGCDGVTFTASGSCPGRHYAHRGPCDMPPPPDGGIFPGFNCDGSTVACDALPPVCEAGYTASVSGSCWGDCVPNEACNPIRCDPTAPATYCPVDYDCDPSTRFCAPRAG